MTTVSEQLRDWLARAEMLARGLDGHRRHALEALEAARPWDARADALQILSELPRSPIALALWADAAEALMLDHEAAEALERLARELPFRADVWLRLAGVAQRLAPEQRERLAPESLLERAAHAGDPLEAADSARSQLIERCLERGELERAARWLDELGAEARVLPDTRRRAAWLALESGELERARRIEAELPEPSPIDGRGWLLRGRLSALDDEARAAHAFARALLLDAPGAERIVSRFVARARDPELARGLSEIVRTSGHAERPLWQAALLTRQGRASEGLELLARAARRHDARLEAIDDYTDAALELRGGAALAEAASLARSRRAPLGSDVERLVAALATAEPAARLDALDGVEGRAAAWAEQLRRDVFRGWLPEGRRAAWRELLQQAALLADELGDPGLLTGLRDLSLDLGRPLRLAVIGEFNAGKSTFINALLGAAVAPTGVLPTTASVHHVLWGAEHGARIEFRDLRPSRTTSHGELGRTLAALPAELVERVEIHAPLELLRRLEIVDTPGFNAPERAHAEAARTAIGAAHVVFWLLDAAQPFKESERAVAEELARHGLPLFVLINKLDRLAAHDLPAVVAHVADSLGRLHVRTEAEPVVFSARQALAGRAGDAALLDASNWPAVTRLIDELVAARSELLRERALRARFRSLTASLGRTAERAARRRRDALEVRRAQQRDLLELARSVRERRATLSAELAGLAEQRVAALWPVSLSGLASANAAERKLLVARARATLGQELVDALLAGSGASTDTRAELRPELELRVGALVAALAPALARPGLGEVAFGGGARAALVTHLAELALDELLQSFSARREPVEHVASSRAERRLRALIDAFEVTAQPAVQ